MMIGCTRRGPPWLNNMLDYSIGEAESLVLKAYRGAGFSWGLAQEAGNAAAWMSMHRLPAIDQFATLLTSIDQKESAQLTPLVNNGSAWHGPAAQLCPVISGLAFAESDLHKLNLHAGLVLHDILQPLIMLPFIAHAAKLLKADLKMNAGGYEVVCGKQGQGIEVVTAPHDNTITRFVRADLQIRLASNSAPLNFTLQQRATANTKSAEALDQLAHRTYVAATEKSRSEAGAGFLDND